MVTNDTQRTRPAGLTDSQVAERRARHGWNELPSGKRMTAAEVLLRQIKNILVLLLLAAATAAFFLGERVDTIAILLVVALNAGLGFIQEWKAENALDALRGMLTPKALVIRNGWETQVESRELVPGDIVLLEAGDNVPADVKLLSALELKVDESVLTGESVPVSKPSSGNDAVAYMGTSIVAGRTEGEVIAIGAGTSFGRIAHLTGSVAEKKTNLQRKLGFLAQQIGIAALAVAALVLLAGIAVGQEPFEMFMTALSVAVAIVPEGLPAVVTITLALGAAAMVRQKALIRRLQAVETLGAASVICTDKTGTLTENKMTATAIWMLGNSYRVTGTGYDPAGRIECDGAAVRCSSDPGLARLLDTATTCNHARLKREGDVWSIIGDPTEGALEALAYKGQCEFVEQRDIISEIPFSSERKRMSVLSMRDGSPIVFSKGATEQVLDMCGRIHDAGKDMPLTAKLREEVMSAHHGMAAQGLRVIALASGQSKDGGLEESNLTFLGLAGLIDPPRPEVKGAVKVAASAGIRIIVITGDSPVTAAAIADDLGIATDRVMTGTDVQEASEQELAEAVESNVLFARTRPSDKMRIVNALQSHSQIVAMTGDGVNDAPALKQADIGVAMGTRGTHVAKEASDLVLLDDNFATIVRAIAEGRRQFENVQKFVRYLLCSNAGEIIAILLNILIGGPLIFLATQILWMNLITDGVTAITLGLEKSEKDQMQQPPRRMNARILGGSGVLLICAFGIYTGLASLWIFYWALPLGEDVARTSAFTAMVIFEKVSVFAFRSLRSPNWRIGWLSNRYLVLAFLLMIAAQLAAVYWGPLQALLRTAPLGGGIWLAILALAAPLLIVPEIVKTALFVPRTDDRARQAA